jgi:hypothetical protein
MALKFKAKSKEEIPAELQAFYTERDGAFVLDVEGTVDKSRMRRFKAAEKNLTNRTCLTDASRRPGMGAIDEMD